MPQLLNMLAVSPKESQSANVSKDSHTSEMNNFSNVFNDEQSKLSSPRTTEVVNKPLKVKEQTHSDNKPASGTDKSDANLILRQIKMGEELDKGQNIAAKGDKLPPVTEDAELSSKDITLKKDRVDQSLLAKKAGQEAKPPSDGIWPVMEEPTTKVNSETAENSDAEKSINTDAKGALESERQVSERNSLALSVTESEIANEIAEDTTLKTEGEKLTQSQGITNIADIDTDTAKEQKVEIAEVKVASSMSSAENPSTIYDSKPLSEVSDAKPLNIHDAKPLSGVSGSVSTYASSLEGKRDAFAQSQLAKASFTLVSEGEANQDDAPSSDKKVNQILGAATGDAKSRLSYDAALLTEGKGGDKEVLVKEQVTGKADVGIEKMIDKLGLKASGEMSEKVAHFQTQQLTRENALGASVDIGSRESSTFLGSGLSQSNSMTPTQNANQGQLVQLSLRQGGEAPAQLQEMIQRFNPVMKQQLMTMVKNGVQHAEIRLDPAELGSMVVKVQVNGDQTQVQFQAAQPQTREMLEQALPKLRDMLSEQGMELTDSQVSQEDHSQQKGDGDSFEGNESAVAYDMNEISAEDLSLGTNQATSYTSGIDYYA